MKPIAEETRKLFGNVENFKNATHKYITSSLFKETADNNDLALFTLKEVGDENFISLREEFMKDGDPTGYTTALRIFGSYRLWRALLQNREIKAFVEEYQDEMEVKLKVEAIRKMRKMDNPTAQKWLADKGWLSQRGRPSKAEKQREQTREASLKRELSEDAERILSAVK